MTIALHPVVPFPSCASRTTSPRVLLCLFLSLEFWPIFTRPEEPHSSLSCAGKPRAQRWSAGQLRATQCPDACGGLVTVSPKPESSQPCSPGPLLGEGGAWWCQPPGKPCPATRLAQEGEKRRDRTAEEASGRRANRSVPVCPRPSLRVPVGPCPPPPAVTGSPAACFRPPNLGKRTARAGALAHSSLAHVAEEQHTQETGVNPEVGVPSPSQPCSGRSSDEENTPAGRCVHLCVSEALTSESVIRQGQTSESRG